LFKQFCRHLQLSVVLAVKPISHFTLSNIVVKMKIICSALFLVILVNYSVQMTEIKIATYEEIKDLPNSPEKLLIDVREPHELENTGRIPTSINIPRKSFLQIIWWS